MDLNEDEVARAGKSIADRLADPRVTMDKLSKFAKEVDVRLWKSLLILCNMSSPAQARTKAKVGAQTGDRRCFPVAAFDVGLLVRNTTAG